MTVPNQFYPTKPHAPQAAQIVPGSPLAVTGIFLEVLRERFGEGQEVPWTWRRDVTLTDVMIEAGYNAELAARGTSVGIYVNRNQTVPGTIVIGDLAAARLPKLIEVFTLMMTSSYSIDCVSPDKGESALLADTVQFTLIGANNLIEGYFGLHSLGMPIMGQTLPFEHGPTKYSTSLSFDVQYQTTWRTQKLRPLLQQVMVRVTDAATGMDAAGNLTDTTLASMSQEWPQDPLQGTVEGTPIIAPEEPPVPGPVRIPQDTIFMPNLPLLGVTDAVNRSYSTSMPFLRTDIVAEVVYRNGVRADQTSYTVSSTRPDGLLNTITFNDPPLPGELLVLDAYLPKVD